MTLILTNPGGRFVKSRGPEDARIMVIGEAPGAQEEREGQPFVGAAGQLLDEMLLSVGINPTNVRYANLTGYRPPANELKAFHDSKGTPNATLLSGLQSLKEEIAHVKPNVIIPLGNYPLRYVAQKGRWGKDGATGITDWRGSVIQGSALGEGFKCLPTFHPANVLRQYQNKAIVKLDLAKALAESASPTITRRAREITIDPQGTDREFWRRRLLDNGTIITADIEYTGSRLLCCSLTTSSSEAVVIRTRNEADITWLRDILMSGKPLCFQNGMFDCSILEWFYNIECVRHLAYDTMIAAHACYVEFPKDLGFLCSIYTDQPCYWTNVNWSTINKQLKAGDSSSVDSLDFMTYNGIDAYVTHEVMEGQIADDLTDPKFKATFDFEMSLVRPLWEISKRGVPIDTAKLGALRTQLETESGLLLQGIRLMNEGAEVNPRSGPQLAGFLKRQGFILTSKTAGGADKTDDTTLANLALAARTDRQRNAVKAIRAYKERVSLISKFCDIELDDDGRMRCHYDPAKTGTGRLSSRKFYPTGRGSNLQNIPRDGRVRSVFVPDAGKLFGYADLKQAESLVVSHITQDAEMLRLHHTQGLDGHKYVAAYLFDKPIESITKDERFIGKKVRHACNYTLGWSKLQAYINSEAQETGVSITAAEAKTYVAKYRQLHYMLPVWWKRVEYQLYQTRTLVTLLGRKRTFYGRVGEMVPEAVAYVPQGTVADTLNVGLVRCAESTELRDLGFEMLLQVHDAIGFQFEEANAERTLTLLRELMTVELTVPAELRCDSAGVPDTFTIATDIQVGANWGEAGTDNPNGLVVWNG